MLGNLFSFAFHIHEAFFEENCCGFPSQGNFCHAPPARKQLLKFVGGTIAV